MSHKCDTQVVVWQDDILCLRHELLTNSNCYVPKSNVIIESNFVTRFLSSWRHVWCGNTLPSTTHIHTHTHVHTHAQTHTHTPLYTHTAVDEDCFYYNSWRNHVAIAFGTLSTPLYRHLSRTHNPTIQLEPSFITNPPPYHSSWTLIYHEPTTLPFHLNPQYMQHSNGYIFPLHACPPIYMSSIYMSSVYMSII